MTDSAVVRFTAAVEQAAGRNATGIHVPDELVAELNQGKRPKVRATLGGHTYRTTLGSMDGRTMLSVSAAVRKAPRVRAV